MTMEEIIVRAYVGLGEPSDLSIYGTDPLVVDPTTRGWALFVGVLNQSQLELATWKFPDGRQLRMRLNDAEALFQAKVQTVTVASVVSTGVVVLTGWALSDDALRGRLVLTATGAGIVYSAATAGGDTTVFLMRVTGTLTAGQTATVHERSFVWTPTAAALNPTLLSGLPYQAAQGRPLEIISVVDVEAGSALSTTRAMEVPLGASATTGTPAAFEKLPNGLRLDTYPATSTLYQVRYVRGPRVLGTTDGAVEPEVPAQMHKALELMLIWWGLRRSQESTDAYAVKKDLDDFLRRVRTEYDFQDELTQGQVKFYPEGR